MTWCKSSVPYLAKRKGDQLTNATKTGMPAQAKPANLVLLKSGSRSCRSRIIDCYDRRDMFDTDIRLAERRTVSDDNT